MHNPDSVLENETHKILWDFEIQTDSLILDKGSNIEIVKKKKEKKKKKKKKEKEKTKTKTEKQRTSRIMKFAVPADLRVKLKESEKRDKYLDLAREQKKQWSMKVTVIPIVIDAHGTVTKGLIKRLKDLKIRGRVRSIQTTALSRSARILGRVLKTWGDLLTLKLQWKTIS